MKRFSLLVSLALTGLTSAAVAESGSWACEKQAISDPSVKAALDEIAPNNGIRRIAVEYMRRWDAQEMLRQCEAYAAGKPAEISCLNGRRDWQAIENMIPDELYGLRLSDMRPHYLDLQENDDGRKAAWEFCKSVGASSSPKFEMNLLD